MKRILTVALVALAITTGCFLPAVNFEVPTYEAIDLSALPAKVERSFGKQVPGTPIIRAETLVSPATGVSHYRLLFDVDGTEMEVRFDQRGKSLGEPMIAGQGGSAGVSTFK